MRRAREPERGREPGAQKEVHFSSFPFGSSLPPHHPRPQRKNGHVDVHSFVGSLVIFECKRDAVRTISMYAHKHDAITPPQLVRRGARAPKIDCGSSCVGWLVVVVALWVEFLACSLIRYGSYISLPFSLCVHWFVLLCTDFVLFGYEY